ncbi:unnamed protein product [Clonostachys rosea]|uniref:Amino acid transporter n=1 Tax=Bionectria ochroleuca TaxID=29856 RepID=A0ABY6V226_BIOOC|nr:unnamed protein product [Clonostachys rosea]
MEPDIKAESDVDAATMQLEPTSSAHFKKDLSWIGILAAGFNVNNSWLVIAATLSISLSYGPMNSMWGLIVVAPIYLAISLTLAELVSAYPTAGGQYHWAHLMAPEKFKKFAGYICGFVSWTSWLAMTASSASAPIFCVYALVLYVDPSFTPQTWQSFLIYQASVVISVLFTLFGKKIMESYYTIGFICSVAAFFSFSVTTLVMQKQKQDSATLWTLHTEESGWPVGLQFLIALTAPVIAFSPMDGAVHLVDEVKNARTVVPRTILTALAISVLTSLGFLLSMMYCVTDFEAVLASPSGFPLFEIWSQATSTSAVPIAFTSITLFLLPVGTIACAQVASTMTWSLARDNGLVFGSHLRKINLTLNTPIWATLLNGCILFIVGCLYFASSLAFNSIVGVAVIFQQITTAIPTAFLVYNRRSSDVLPDDRTFKLSPVIGWTANIVTLLFASLAVPVFLIPAVDHPSPSLMNYGIVVVAGAVTLALVNWFTFARTKFSGPAMINFNYD